MVERKRANTYIIRRARSLFVLCDVLPVLQVRIVVHESLSDSRFLLDGLLHIAVDIGLLADPVRGVPEDVAPTVSLGPERASAASPGGQRREGQTYTLMFAWEVARAPARQKLSSVEVGSRLMRRAATLMASGRFSLSKCRDARCMANLIFPVSLLNIAA